ncbi:hypothetical protein [Selenihalanaerobacter shriftii]|uniref:WxL domain-containing protein n=1 Tax=Selenihalanaerobacter shriftii TaxID=142842 RepID=A0A1T4JR31_9FIRM|nr:hypothetical protein [Selenihalanaerobacter shriftii]SJZ32584.1 hypothetical protein SAMN02745118_00341 [Selenihalanaerobacter shriftii]
MKKLMIFGLAMMLVFGMSVVSMAAEQLDKSVLGVDLTVEEYAEIGFDEASYNFTFLAPNVDNNGDGPSHFFPFNVKSNTPVTITATEGLTSLLQGMVPEGKVWTGGDRGDTIVSPYMTFADENQNFQNGNDSFVKSGANDGDGWTSKLNSDAGNNNYTLYLGAQWFTDKDWWELEATDGDKEFNLQLTVAAPQTL